MKKCYTSVDFKPATAGLKAKILVTIFFNIMDIYLQKRKNSTHLEQKNKSMTKIKKNKQKNIGRLF